ncbi:MAG: Gfo/Idh/MocA family oxidoreductase [Verrucomicrobia bacterium]|nr:Gfo/Idh/MocA family oxidoreductase [Verrucomicrobiota bacterium]
MKILQLGSGSMGTRRLRDLHQRKDLSLAMYDEREDRRQRAQERFGLTVFSRFEDALAWDPEALVISTPPGTKGGYIKLALERGLHHFIEADIWSYGAAEIERVSRQKKLVSAPSASLLYLPVVRALGSSVRDQLGSLLSYQFFMATFMPGWHTGEGQEYYARHRNTAPSREMIPFELNWLNPLFGPATEVAGRFEKYGALPDDTEDTWSLSMRLRTGGIGQLTITMSCPVDYRRGCCFGTKGMITWDIYSGDLAVQTAADKAPRQQNFGAIGSVIEEMYLEEISTFIDAIQGKKTWPQSYALSQQSSATLASAEKSSVTGQWVKVDPNAEPAAAPPRRP